jgi:hypothetical protein
MKIILKGVGTAEDAVRALEAGCDGVLLSNHGGRQLDFARSGLEVLPEAMAALRAHKKYSADKFEVYVDGGVRRGTDVFKALALGAKAVGIGRPALYAMSAFGAEGVAKMLQILKAELEMTMRLMGTAKLSDIKEGMVITEHLKTHIATVPSDFLQSQTYIPAVTQAQLSRDPELQYLNSRAQDVAGLESTIAELGTLFSRLASVVVEQGAQVERIDSDLEAANRDLEAGQAQLQKSWQSASSNSGLALRVMGVLVSFAVFYGIVLV